jgi:holin-like protein
MTMIAGFSIIFICLLIGEGLAHLLRLPIPGNVIGMVTLTAALMLGIVRVEQVKPVADGLLKQLALLFVPPGVGLLLYGDLLKTAWLSIGVSLVVSTIIVLGVVGGLQQYLERRHD